MAEYKVDLVSGTATVTVEADNPTAAKVRAEAMMEAVAGRAWTAWRAVPVEPKAEEGQA